MCHEKKDIQGKNNCNVSRVINISCINLFHNQPETNEMFLYINKIKLIEVKTKI